METFEHIHGPGDLVGIVPTMFPGGGPFMGMYLTKDGFWTPPYTREKRPGTFRLLILGDSFAFSSGGVPFERTWHTLVAQGLQHAWARPVEPVNLGVPGAGPRLEGRVYDVEGAALKPDLVILGLFLGNDLTDESHVRSLLERSSLLVRLLENLNRVPDFVRLIVYSGRLPYESIPDWAPGRYVYDPTKATFPEEVFVHIEEERTRVFSAQHVAWAHDRIRSVADVLSGLQTRVTAAGGAFAVVVIPDELEVNADLRRVVLQHLEAAGGIHPQLDIDGFHQSLASELAARQISFLDLLPALREAARERSPYRLRDTHWDDRGNRLAADAIVSWVLDNDRKLGLGSRLAVDASAPQR